MDEEEQEACIAHQHVTHFLDNKHHNKVIDGMTVDIGTQFDWSKTLYKENAGFPWTALCGSTKSVQNMIVQ